MSHRIYLGLGSNLGDRLGYLNAAISAMPPAVNVLRRSPVYETAPWGFADQGDFLNMAVEAETELGPKQLLIVLKGIEMKLGRKPRFQNGPREIDIDILLYDDQVFEDASLRIPHPRLYERAFVLTPLADLAPDMQIPGTDKTVAAHLAQTEKTGIRIFEDNATT